MCRLEGTRWFQRSNPLAQAEPCPDSFQISSKMENTQQLWATLCHCLVTLTVKKNNFFSTSLMSNDFSLRPRSERMRELLCFALLFDHTQHITQVWYLSRATFKLLTKKTHTRKSPNALIRLAWFTVEPIYLGTRDFEWKRL